MKQNSRTRLLEVTARLLREQGYAATTLSQILEQSQTSRSSLYFLFPEGKSELARAAIREQHNQLMRGLQRLQVRYPYAGQGIPALFHYFGREMEGNDYLKGSALAAVTLGVPDQSVQGEVSRCYRELTQFLRAWLAHSGMPAAQAAGRAQLPVILLEGALLLCKAHRSSDPLKQAINQLGFEPFRAVHSACQASSTEG